MKMPTPRRPSRAVGPSAAADSPATTLAAASLRDPIVIALGSAYFELALEGGDAAAACEIAICAGLLADVETLVAVGRNVRDPMPWRPFLHCLSAIPPDLRTPRSIAALVRLDAVARAMLHRQGLALVRPEDCLAHASILAETMASIAAEI